MSGELGNEWSEGWGKSLEQMRGTRGVGVDEQRPAGVRVAFRAVWGPGAEAESQGGRSEGTRERVFTRTRPESGRRVGSVGDAG